ncbi:hypothetical protein RHMOL_Rhmol05G0024300 [Rhododendron molle]|uniref:Uncharacterized protein n=1 Tax=Rhododendron molle TaxID=49168 RepID=A0ACC0NLU2_RHOML|nr:hypothetical protein RHMOL_Rhmol05G0024300 [Rhododendron molle]
MASYVSMGEAHRRITDYLNRFSDAVSYQDGSSLKRLLSISSDSPSLLSLSDALNVFQDASRLIKQFDKYSQFGEILVPLFRSLQNYRLGHLVESYQSFEKSANAFLQEFRNWESAWALDALYVVAYEIRVLAERADRELASMGKIPEKLKGAGSFLMKVFGVLAGKGPKRVGALYVTCQLFKIYFKVTYMYYTGRLEVFNENFPAADHKLSYALTYCNPHREANIRFGSEFRKDINALFQIPCVHTRKGNGIGFDFIIYINIGSYALSRNSFLKDLKVYLRMILKYLIPVKLSIGILPMISLLEKYNLVEYSNVVQAMRRGDLRLLRQALQEHEDQFLRSGVYLVLEKLELQVYQRLIKKIYIIQKQKDPSKAHQIKLEVIVKALKWLEMDMDVDEVECIMSILIYKNLMKGYFAHKSKVVVLSKQDPFPKLNGKPVNS